MTRGHRSPADPEARIEEALADAEVGRELFFESLAALDAVEVEVTAGTAAVTITLPVAGEGLRGAIDREVRRAVLGVEGVRAVDCRVAPDVVDPQERVELVPEVKHVVAVASGKGGVGKSTVAVNVAAALADAGAAVGLLDADVYGPNAPAMLGLGESPPNTTPEDRMVPREAHGVTAMSMGFIVEEDDPVIWRGPIVDDFLKQLFDDVEWGSLDYLIVDLPPGTGDAHLSLVQHLPVTGAVIVTTPQPLAVDDARRGLRGFARYDVPVLGVAANMTAFECPDCGTDHDVFGTGGAERLAGEFDVPVLGRIPIDPAVGDPDGEATDTDPPGVTIPGIGRLQLPRTRAEREGTTAAAPLVVADPGSDASTGIELVATRTAARISRLHSTEATTR